MPEIVSVESASSPFEVDIRAGRHALQADELVSAGGRDVGPRPYELLLAALGSCKAITMRMYAERKNWPLQAVHVFLKHGKEPAESADDGGSERRLIDAIDVEMRLDGNLSEEQRQALFAIAEKCPLHRTLSAGVQIRTSDMAGCDDTQNVAELGQRNRRWEC